MFTLNDPVFLIPFPQNNPKAIWTHSHTQHNGPFPSYMKFQRNFGFSHLEVHVNFVFYSTYYTSLFYKFKILNYVQVKSLNSSSTWPHSPSQLNNSRKMHKCLLCCVVLNSPENNWLSLRANESDLQREKELTPGAIQWSKKKWGGLFPHSHSHYTLGDIP